MSLAPAQWMFELVKRRFSETLPYRCCSGGRGWSLRLVFFSLQLFDVDEDGYISEDEFSTILQASLGVPDLDVSGLFKEIAQGDSVSYGE